MKSIFRKLLENKQENCSITIVSGLPRSGTSMMMQMLEAGGIPILTDNIREADKDNPKGYYEFEKIKKIEHDSSWLEICHGKACKMVSSLLYYLPNNKHYKVIFMRRKMAEILSSQKVMLKHRGESGAGLSDEEMALHFQKHLEKLETWLEKQSHIDVLYINYNNVITNPHGNAKIVNSFLGNTLDIQKAASIVEKSLYRQRKKA